MKRKIAMNKKLAAAVLVASLAGGTTAAGFASAGPAFAADSDTGTTVASTPIATAQNWINTALKPLVEKGTLTQTQSDAVVQALDDARPEHGRNGPGGDKRIGNREKGMRGIGPVDQTTAAGLLGLTNDSFHEALHDPSKTLADLAKEKNVDVQNVINEMVKADNAAIDKAVTDGKLTQAQADAAKANVTQRVTDMVNGKQPERGMGGGRGKHGGADGGSDGGVESGTEGETAQENA